MKMNIVRGLTRIPCNLTSKSPALRTLCTQASALETPQPDKLFKTVELEVRGHDSAVLKSFVKFATTAAHHLEVETANWDLRKPVHERYTVLKAVHIYKKHRVQYETRTYFSFVQFKYLTGSTADTLLEYVQRNLPEGVALKTTKIEIQRLPKYLHPTEEQLVLHDEIGKPNQVEERVDK